MPRTDQLFHDIVRLRRAEREAPGLRDVVAVRAHLEEELGGTVSRAAAARLIGVSHSALQRWIDAGDVPVVITPTGRSEVPIAALAELHEAVSRERVDGTRSLHVLEPAIAGARARAAQLRPRELVGDADDTDDPHRRAALRNRAYHAAIAQDLDQESVDRARHQIWAWSETERIDPHYAEVWEELLDRPLDELRRLLPEDSERMRDLRQNSPFAGMLSEPERRRILEEIR